MKKKRVSPKELKASRKSYLIPYNNRWRKVWDYSIIVIAIYSTFTIPIKLAFNPDAFGLWYDVMDWITSIIYVVDIVIQFRTTYLDNFGQEIKDGVSIARRYFFSTRFWIDFFALLANPFTERIQWIQFVGILKLNRVFRLKQLITQANMEKNVKAVLKIFYFAFILYVYIHLTACIFFYIIKIEEKWIPPFDFIDYSQSRLFDRFDEDGVLLVKGADFTRQYWISVYYCVLVLGGNELGPSSDWELFYIVSINLVGAIANAQIFGELAVLLSQLNRKDATYQKVVDSANTAMENINLPSELRVRVREYFQKVQTTQSQQDELDKFLDQISPSLKLRVQSQIFSTVLFKNSTI